MLIINEEKCNKDGICAAECPAMIIQLKNGNGLPDMVPGGDQICIRCGHCVAVCPKGALSHEQIPISQCPRILKELGISEEQAVQYLRSRRSIRVCKEKPVEKEKIQRMIDIARYAPTGSNSQMVEWSVHADGKKVHEIAVATVDWIRSVIENESKTADFSVEYLKLFVAAWDSGYDGILRNAPALVVAMAPKETGSGIVDPVIALTYLELAALTQGLSTCWAGVLYRAMLNDPGMRTRVGVPKDYPYYYPMMVGYPKFNYFRLPERNKAKIKWM